MLAEVCHLHIHPAPLQLRVARQRPCSAAHTSPWPMHALPCCHLSCCAASRKFNDARCNCNSQIRELAKSFVGGDAGVYSRVSAALARGCRYAPIC